MNILSKYLLAISFASLSFSSAMLAPASAQGGSCLGNREIQSAIAAGQILPLADALANAGVDSSQQVLSVKVCDNGGQLVYIVAVINANGEAESLTLAAN